MEKLITFPIVYRAVKNGDPLLEGTTVYVDCLDEELVVNLEYQGRRAEFMRRPNEGHPTVRQIHEDIVRTGQWQAVGF